MKKTRKRILGLAGLFLVAFMTVLALLLPDSGASALTTNPITDEVQVQVVGSEPDVTIASPGDDAVLVEPSQYFQFDFANVDTTSAELQYTDASGDTHIYTIDTLDPHYDPTTGSSPKYVLELLGEGYGYGEYQLTVTGIGFDGAFDEDTVKFSFYPVYGEVFGPDNDNNYSLGVHYDEDNEDLDTIEINVYGPDGELITDLSPIRIKAPESEVDLPFGDLGLPSGTYTVEIVALDKDANRLFDPYDILISYTKKGDPEPVPAPDTGSFFGGINVSSTDITITALVVFVLFSAVAAAIIIKSRVSEKA